MEMKLPVILQHSTRSMQLCGHQCQQRPALDAPFLHAHCFVPCRARLVASSRAASPAAAAEPATTSSSSSSAPEGAWATTRSSFNQLEWAHELSKPEAGCLLLAHPYMFRERQVGLLVLCLL